MKNVPNRSLIAKTSKSKQQSNFQNPTITWEKVQIEARFVYGSIWRELYCHLTGIALQLLRNLLSTVSSQKGRGVLGGIIYLKIIIKTFIMAFDIEGNKANSNPKMLEKNHPQKVSLGWLIKNQTYKLTCETWQDRGAAWGTRVTFDP